ncbi:MAG: PD40 domain-containing protein, partial [Anaerolineales bacterium]|nr:PD40 domain-containing protein [Anaerolineales bacterium]
MKKGIRSLIGYITLVFAVLACSLPANSDTEQIPSDQVATVVAATMQALTPDSSSSATPESESPSILLPRSLYYLGSDDAGLAQVFRMENDGETIAQLTFEPDPVEYYDVSSLDGSVVYLSNNQMLLIQADGSDRRILGDGGAVDENNPYLSKISNPVFSPDGQTIAYSHKGLNLYSVLTGASNLVIEDQWNDVGGGLFIPSELYWPEGYSLDGSKLLVTLGYYEGASTAVYYPASNALTRLSGGEGAIICCGDYHLSDDGSVLYAASPHMGMFNAGLWRVDIASGVVTALLSADFDSNPAEVADNPFLAPDGQLYFFYASVPNTEGFIDRAPLQIVRSAPDGVTGRVVLRPETFPNMWEALWAPDAGFVIVTISKEDFQGREAQLV